MRVGRAIRDLLPRKKRMGDASRLALSVALSVVAKELIENSVIEKDETRGKTLRSSHLLGGLRKDPCLSTIIKMPYVADKHCMTTYPESSASLVQRVKNHAVQRKKTKRAVETLQHLMPKSVKALRKKKKSTTTTEDRGKEELKRKAHVHPPKPKKRRKAAQNDGDDDDEEPL